MFITLKMSYLRTKTMTKNKLWQTGSDELRPLVESYTVGDDYKLDQQLLPYDIKASIAHAGMLFEIGVINKTELSQLKDGLQQIQKKLNEGKFTISKSQEDGHTAIEQYLTEKYGEVGKKIHTGRSRNDQSLVMIRLFMKEKLEEVQNDLERLIQAFEKKSESNQKIPMPGYTHLQKAMPTTVGTWLESFSAALTDSKLVLEATMKIIDQNPLGSASGFGIEKVSLDRESTTKMLHFKKTQENPMYCGMSRGYFENVVLQSLSQPMIIASKFACDLLLFTMSEFAFFSLPDSFTTGSSIMPQKKNYDVLEVMRGNAKVFSAYQNEIQSIVASIGSGYQRDLQLTKKPFILGVNLCCDTIILLTEIIDSLMVNEANLKKSMTDDLYATEKVYKLVKKGMPFREAYGTVAKKYK